MRRFSSNPAYAERRQAGDHESSIGGATPATHHPNNGHDALTSLGRAVRSNRAHELVSLLLKAGIGIDWGESAVAIE
jgi:hypothetical protein